MNAKGVCSVCPWLATTVRLDGKGVQVQRRHGGVAIECAYEVEDMKVCSPRQCERPIERSARAMGEIEPDDDLALVAAHDFR